MRIEQKQQITSAAVLGLIAAVFAGWMFHERPAPGDVEVDYNAGRFVVSDEEHRFEYALGRRESLTVTMSMSGAQRGIKEGGALRTVHFFDDAATRKYKSQHGPGSKCPAPFFRRYAHQKILFAKDARVMEQVMSLPEGSYTDSSAWHRVTLHGRCLKSLEHGERRGREVRLPRNFFDNCLSFMVERVSVGPRGRI